MTRNKKIVISVISAIVAVIVLFSVIMININSAAAAKLFKPTGIQVTDINFEADYKGDSTANISRKNNAGKGYVKVAETQFLELYYKKDRMIASGGEKTDFDRYDIAVYDKRSKALWKALPDDKHIDYDQAVDSLLAEMQSLVRFEYFDIGKDNNKTFASSVLNELVNANGGYASGGGEEEIDFNELFGIDESEFDDQTELGSSDTATNGGTTNVELSKIPNGIRFSYNLTNLSLKFAVDFKIDGDKFDVVIPQDQIEDQLQNYKALKEERAKMATEVTALSDQVAAINKLDVSRKLPSDSRSRISKSVRNSQNKINGLVDNCKAGGDTSHSIVEVEEALNQLSDTMDAVGGFDGVIDPIRDKLFEIKNKLSSMTASSLCGLVSLTPLPYFGGATAKEDGYVFYPDGSGALSYFNVKHPEYATAFRKDVYSNHISDIATYLNWVSEEDESIHEEYTTVAMPVFGIKKANSAFVGIIAEGDSDAAVYYAPYSESIEYNSINAAFYMRKTTQNTSSVGDVSQIIDPDIINQPRRLRYVFTAGKDADYAGMAVKYREHLEKYGLIKQSEYLKSDDIPMFVEMFMGYKTSGTSVMPVYRGTTSFNQAQDILKDMKNRGIGTINATLTGWSESGYYDTMPDYSLKPEKEIGGKKDLIALSDYASANNVSISLEDQFMFATDSDISYNDKDIATTKNYGGFTIEAWKRYMFNPAAVYNKVMDGVSRFKSYKANGATLKYEGSILYNDYNVHMKNTVKDENGADKAASSVCDRNLTMATMRDLGLKVKEQMGHVNYRNPRMYMANVADWFVDAPLGDTEMLIGDEAVPFMQIALHGYIPYTSGHLNNMYDLAEQRLKYIEYGVMPCYVVTGSTPDSRENYTDFLFSTKYADWADTMQDTYKEYKANVNDTWKVKIADHETVQKGVVCVTYENGVKIVLNYNKKPVKYGKLTIAAQDYTVIR